MKSKFPQKIHIVGVAGMGKTYLAEKLSKMLKVKTVELDNLFFGKDYSELSPPKIRDKNLKNIIKRKKWIIEGSHSEKWINPIIEKADLIINLDLKLFVAKKRVIIRHLKRRIKGNSKKEKLKDTLKLFKFINRKSIIDKRIRNKAKKYKKKIIALKNEKEVNKFIKEWKLKKF